MLKINKIRIEQNMEPKEGDAVSYSLQESKQKYFDSENVVEGRGAWWPNETDSLRK